MKTAFCATIAVATAASAIALAPPASAREILITELNIWIDNCSAIGDGQFCPSNANVPNNGAITRQYTNPAKVTSIKLEFIASPRHCSDIIAHAYFDGQEWGSHIAAPGQSDGGGYEIPSDYGLHKVAYQAEGVPGGCNTGRLDSWGGTMRVYALYPD
jgi:hypothetical protein